MLDVRLVAHLVQKPLSGAFKAQGEIGFLFYNDVKAFLDSSVGKALSSKPSIKLPPCPKNWVAPKPSQADGNQNANVRAHVSKCVDVATNVSANAMIDYLASKGCTVDAKCVETNAHGRAFVVMEVTEVSVKLRLATGTACSKTIKIPEVLDHMKFEDVVASKVHVVTHVSYKDPHVIV